MNSSNQNNKAFKKVNRAIKHGNNFRSSSDGAYEKKRSLSDEDSCIQNGKLNSYIGNTSKGKPNTEASSHTGCSEVKEEPYKHSVTKINPVDITRSPVDRAPVPVAFTHDDFNVRRATQMSKSAKKACMGQPEWIEDEQAVPVPIPPHGIGFISSERYDGKKYDDGQSDHSQQEAIRRGHLVHPQTIGQPSHSSDISISATSKDGQSATKSRDTELAVATPVRDNEVIYEATHYDPLSKTTFYNNKRFRLCTLAILLVIAVVIVVSVYYSITCCANETQEALEPALAPMTYREHIIQQFFDEFALERSLSFDELNFSDPRYLALNWIVHEDKLQLSVGDTNLLQRYVLALLAFSFDFHSWSCGMVHGLVACNGTDADDYALWLSGADECYWYGIECVDGFVQKLDLSEFPI